MDRRKDIKTKDLISFYVTQHLSSGQISKITGLSRTSIIKRLNKAGINTSKGNPIDTICDFCGSHFNLVRSRWRNSEKHYCKTECYYASLENPGYHPWRQGQRIARAIISQYFPIQPEHIPHHKDGDCRNNNPTNLSVYASQSDHLKATHHKNSTVKPIWDGESVQNESYNIGNHLREPIKELLSQS